MLVMAPIPSEKAQHIAEFCRTFLAERVREQVRYVASDQPSRVLFESLKDVFPSFAGLYLDAMHLVMVYNTAFWRRDTPGQHAVRRIQAKFSKVDYSRHEGFWGAIYEGQDMECLTEEEERARALILTGDMSAHRAVYLLNNMDDACPWYRRVDFILAIAAVAASFPAEMDRRTYVQGRPMRRVLWTATAPSRLAWLWNALVIRRQLPRRMQALLGSGTTPNEALHSEINRWYRNQPEVFPSTLALQLEVALMSKLLSHDSAMYSPTLRQWRQDVVLAMGCQGIVFEPNEWAKWCERNKEETRQKILPALLPRAAARKDLSARIRASNPAVTRGARGGLRYTVLKRPAAGVKRRPAGVAEVPSKRASGRPGGVKRTPFTRKRVLKA